MTTFKALIVEKKDNEFHRRIGIKAVADLPDNELLVKVAYSSLNYKDALSSFGNRGVTKRYPHTPGVDCAGVVEESASPLFKSGQKVIVSGFDLGMNTSGGFGGYIKVPASWGVKLPKNLSLKESMNYGTAGFTAAQCVDEIVRHGVKPKHGPILVSGATGGVGSISIAILAKLGFKVTAVTGKSADSFLTKMGAAEIIQRGKLAQSNSRALLRERWAAVVDTVGGDCLAAAIKSSKYGSIITCCGNAASPDLPITVYPFILRGVRLVGIDSAATPIEKREKIWQELADKWRLDLLDELYQEVKLDELIEKIELMMAGKLTGRVVVNLDDS